MLNADDERCAARPDVDATAWAIHGQIHQRLPDVRVVLHLHPVYTTSLACLATPQILPIDQNTARYFNRVAVDTLYGGMADTAAEGARLAGLLADKRRLLMGNHGVLVTAPNIGEAFDDIWTPARLSDPDHRTVNRPAAEGAVRRGGGKTAGTGRRLPISPGSTLPR